MQLNLELSSNINSYNIQNFIVHNGNREIFDFITCSFLILNNFYFLSGPSKSGKTYICNIWHKLKNAVFLDNSCLSLDISSFISYINQTITTNQKYILEDIEKTPINEENLLYLMNYLLEKKSTLIATSEKFLEEFFFEIPDLVSRFKNVFNFTLKNFSDDYKKIILVKIFSDLQINIDDNVLEYMNKKLSNNYKDIFELIKKLETSISSKNIKKITIFNIKNIISN